MSTQLTEKLTVDGVKMRITADGYLVAYPKVARSGIQVYGGDEVGKPDLFTVRVYRPEAEVFNRDSLNSYTHRPVTNDHPPVAVTADNWKDFAVGQTGEEWARDGESVRVPMVLMDASVIKDIRNGKRELSLGYTVDLKWEPGTAPNGEQYDAVQTNIRANHLAVVTSARGGSELRIGDDDKNGETEMNDKVNTTTIQVDGIDVRMDDVSAKIVARAISQMQGRLDSLQAKVDEEGEEKEKVKKEAEEDKKAKDAALSTKDAEIATLRQQLADAAVTPAKLDDMVRERVAVATKAKAVIGDSVVVDGKTVDDIRRQVVDAKLGDVAKGWSNEMVAASFNTLTATASDAGTGHSHTPSLADSLSSRPGPGTGAPPVTADAAYATYEQNLKNAHKANRKAA